MKKPSKKRTKQPTIVVIIVLIIAVVTALQQNSQKSSTSFTTQVVTQMGLITATAGLNTQIPAATSAANKTAVAGVTAMARTLFPSPTPRPLPTDAEGLEITPVTGQLYDITGTVNALRCPDSRCKVIETYKKDSIVVVTGMVMGTTYKNKKTREWVQVFFHDGSKVYIHGAFASPHVSDN